MAEKKLPHNTEAEKAVLGAMLRSTACVSEGMGKLETENFYEENENHRAIFAAMLRLYTRGEPVDTQTITNELIVANELDLAGGTEYLIELADAIITFDNFDNYVKIVQDQAVLRQFLKTIDKIQKKYYNDQVEEIGDFLQNSEKEITQVTERRRVGDFQKAADVSKKLSEEIAALKSSTTDDTVTGTPTGYPRLNMLTHGFQPGELIILAARPGVGKTALSLNLMLNASMKVNCPVAYFSLEMPASQLFKRLVSADAEVNYSSLITGFNLDQHTRLKAQQSCERLATRKIYVDDTSGIKLLDLVAKVRKLKAIEPDLGLIVVDYIGLVTTSSKTKSESRQLEVQMISQTLKKLALDLKVPVIGVAQLNRNVEMRNGGEPQLSDLRESGSIEQDADIVLMLHETKMSTETANSDNNNVLDKHNQEVEEAKAQIAGANKNDIKLVTLFVRKNRSGRTGDVPLLFRRNYCRFDSLSLDAEKKLDEINEEKVAYFPGN